MASKSLGTLTVDLVTKVGGFKQGMEEAERASKKAAKAFAEDQKKLAAELERINQKVLDDKQKLAKRMDGIYKSIGAGLTIAFTAAAAGITAAANVIGNTIQETIEKSRELQRGASLSGVDLDVFQRMAVGAKTVGVEADKLSDIFKDMRDRIGDFAQTGGGPLADFFEKIAPMVGVTIEDFQRLSGPEGLQLFVDSLQKAGVSANDFIFYMEAIASDSSLLIPLLQDGGKGFEEWGNKADAAGAIMSGPMIAALADTRKMLAELDLSIQGVKNTLVDQYLPTINEVISSASEYIQSAQGQKDISDALTATMDILSVAFNVAQVAVGVLQVAFQGIAGPINIFVQLVSGAVQTLKAFYQTAASVLSLIGNADFSGAIAAAKAGVKQMSMEAQIGLMETGGAVGKMVDGIRSGYQKIGNGLTGKNNPFENMNRALGKTQEKAKATTAELKGIASPLKSMNEAMGKAAPAAMGNMKDAMGKVTEATKTQVKAWETASKERQKNLDFFDKEAQAMGRKVNSIKELSEVEQTQWEIEQGKYKHLDEAQRKELLRLAQIQDAEKKLADARKGGGGGGAGGAGKKSEAEKAAEDAAKDMERMEQKRIDAFESAAMKYREMTELSSESTEAEKAYFETTSGSLAFLNSEQKQYLIGMAERADAAKLMHEAEEEAARLAEREAEEAKRRHEDQIERFEDTMASMEHELELLGKTADEQERINLLKHLGVEATKEQTAAAEAQLAQLQTARTAMEQQVEVMDTIRSSFSGAFQDWVSGSKSFKDAFLGALDSINAKILQMIADNLMAKLFGETGSAGGGSMGGGIAGFIGKLFGGGMAIGGYPQAGKMYEVNERGPEMFSVGGRDYLMMGDESGKITPNHKLGGGGGFAQANNFIVQGRIDRRTQEQIAMQVGQRSQVAMRRNG